MREQACHAEDRHAQQTDHKPRAQTPASRLQKAHTQPNLARAPTPRPAAGLTPRPPLAATGAAAMASSQLDATSGSFLVGGSGGSFGAHTARVAKRKGEAAAAAGAAGADGVPAVFAAHAGGVTVKQAPRTNLHLVEVRAARHRLLILAAAATPIILPAAGVALVARAPHSSSTPLPGRGPSGATIGLRSVGHSRRAGPGFRHNWPRRLGAPPPPEACPRAERCWSGAARCH